MKSFNNQEIIFPKNLLNIFNSKSEYTQKIFIEQLKIVAENNNKTIQEIIELFGYNKLTEILQKITLTKEQEENLKIHIKNHKRNSNEI